MAARNTLKTVNDELTRLGHRARLEKASGYYYFYGGEWIDRTVKVAKISDLTLEQWIGEFKRVKKRNAEITKAASRAAGRKPAR